MSQPETRSTQNPPPPISFREAFMFWLKLGFISFGGPAGQISIMHQELVENRRWISERRFLHALNYCMVLPGPEAQQLATYIGWLMHRTWGGIVAGVLFVLPSLFILIALSWMYIAFGDVPLVAGLFYGIKPAVTAIVLQAAHRIGSRALKNNVLWAIAGASFVAIFALNIPFPLIVLAAAVTGFIGGRLSPEIFRVGGSHGSAAKSYGAALIDDDTPAPEHTRFRWARLARVLDGRRAAVAVADGRTHGGVGLGPHADADGVVLHQGGAAHLRRCLRGAALCVSGRGRALRLAHADPDDRRPRAGRNHARPADHGGGLRRFRRRLPQ
jgi:chromate transporter